MRDERNFGLGFGEPLKLKSGVVVGLLAGMAFLLLPLVAEGNALQLASFTYFCGGGPASGPGGNNATLPGSITCTSSFGQGQGQAITTAGLMAGAGASANSPTSYAATGNATILYWAEVVGPSNVTVPLLGSSFGSASASGTGAAGASVTFPGGIFSVACADPSHPSNCGTAPTSWKTVLPFSVLSDVPFNIIESANAGAVDPSGSASATVDPTIVINPSFATGSQFSLIFSSNISPPSAPVPEPGTLTLVALGVGVGSLARRHRRANKVNIDIEKAS